VYQDFGELVLEALLLLPGLFTQVTTADYSAAYTLLKELDYKMTSGVVITGSQKVPPFDNCWLIDERIGGLKDNLPSYADAFAGFLTGDRSGSRKSIGNGRSLGKNREQITLALATEFTFQEVYGELQELIETFEHDLIYPKLQELEKTAQDLTHYERKLLDQLLSEYNPLN
jgi:hypothetical protein